MFNKYNGRSRQVLMHAHNEAKRFQHNYIGTEHILFGILQEGGIASELLSNAKVNDIVLSKKIEQFVGYGEVEVQQQDIYLTPRVKKLMEESVVEAKTTKEELVEPEHMLLAIIREKRGVAYSILEAVGVDFNNLTSSLKFEVKNHNTIKTSIDVRSEQDNMNRNLDEDIKINTPILNKYGHDLTAHAREGNIDPVIGRDVEIERTLEILCRRMKNNPCLIGEPGVGKTAVVEGLAQLVALQKVPDTLRNKRLISISMATMVAGTKYRGEFEERLKSLIEEVTKSKNIILFIDEIHTIVGAGGAEGAIDAANILKPSLARGELQCIGATTIEEYRKHIEKDSALERRFQSVLINEPSKAETIQILQGLKNKYEFYHGVEFTQEAIEAAVNLSTRYIPDKFLPDKAIDLIDEAGAKCRIRFGSGKACSIKDIANSKMRNLVPSNEPIRIRVDEDEIAEVLAGWTRIPVDRLTEKESERLLKLEDILRERIVGQEEAISAISKAVRRARVGFRDRRRPIGSFIFLGPTGVGKTELSKALAEAVFNDEKALIRLDMTEYMEKHSVSKLIGSPPGYIGFEEGGQLTEKVRRRPYSVVLFDEIEKSHPDIFNILLQVLEDGRLTDSTGKTISFQDTIIIMTSNAGTEMLKKQNSLGFSRPSEEITAEYDKMKNILLTDIKKTFKPELLNRIDDTIVFHRLTEENIVRIIDIIINSLCNRAKENKFDLTVTNAAKLYISKQGEIDTYGARPLKRLVAKLVEDKVCEAILMGNFKANDTIVVDMVNNDLIVEKVV